MMALLTLLGVAGRTALAVQPFSHGWDTPEVIHSDWNAASTCCTRQLSTVLTADQGACCAEQDMMAMHGKYKALPLDKVRVKKQSSSHCQASC